MRLLKLVYLLQKLVDLLQTVILQVKAGSVSLLADLGLNLGPELQIEGALSKAMLLIKHVYSGAGNH